MSVISETVTFKTVTCRLQVWLHWLGLFFWWTIIGLFVSLLEVFTRSLTDYTPGQSLKLAFSNNTPVVLY